MAYISLRKKSLSKTSNLSCHIDLRTHTAAQSITLTVHFFDFGVNACQGPATEYNCTKFGIDISSVFFLLEHGQTHTHTDATDHTNHADCQSG